MAEVKHQFYQLPKSMMPGDSNLKPNQLLVWVMIWSWTKDGRPCFISNAGFAKDLNVTERQVKNILKQLKEMGLVKSWYESVNGSSKTRCFRAVLKPSQRAGSEVPNEGDAIPPHGKENAPLAGTEAPYQGEVSFTHIKTDTKSTSTSSIKEDEGIQKQVELWYRELGRNSGVSQTTTKEWCQSFCSDFLKNEVMVDNNGKPVKRRQAFVTKNFEFRLANSKQNFYQRPEKVFDPEQAKRDIRWHRKRCDLYRREGKEAQATKEWGAIERLRAQLEQNGYAVDD